MSELTKRQEEIYIEMRKRANEANKRYYSKTSYAPEHNRPWSEEDDETLLTWVGNEITLSKYLGRSVASIQKRRCKLKKIANGEVLSWS